MVYLSLVKYLIKSTSMKYWILVKYLTNCTTIRYWILVKYLTNYTTMRYCFLLVKYLFYNFTIMMYSGQISHKF